VIKENEIDKSKERDSDENNLANHGPIMMWLCVIQDASPMGEEMGTGCREYERKHGHTPVPTSLQLSNRWEGENLHVATKTGQRDKLSTFRMIRSAH
jgi:hypothetical protein